METYLSVSEWLSWFAQQSALSRVAIICFISCFLVIMLSSLYEIIKSSVDLNIFNKEDIIKDSEATQKGRRNHELSSADIFSKTLWANLGYYTFWNAIIMEKCLKINRVNKFIDNMVTPAEVTLKKLTLAFIWGYPIYLLIMTFRLIFYKGELR